MRGGTYPSWESIRRQIGESASDESNLGLPYNLPDDSTPSDDPKLAYDLDEYDYCVG